MSTWNLPPGVTTNDPHVNPPDETPRFVIVREDERWIVLRQVATVNGVPVYSRIGHTYYAIADATAWVAAQEETR